MSRRAPFQDSSNKGLGRKTRPCHPGGFTGKKNGWGVVLKMRFGNMTIKVFPDLSLLKKGVVGLFPPSLRRKLPVCEGAVTFFQTICRLNLVIAKLGPDYIRLLSAGDSDSHI